MTTSFSFLSINSPSVESIAIRINEKVEQLRIKNHLRAVEQELREKDTSHLSIVLQKERLKNLDHLHNYWENGIFPKNLDFPHQRVPYFKDKAETPCAMAYLIEMSGEKALVDKVSASNNHVYINDIKGGPVMAWIKKSGLTKSESARIQPTYGYCGFGGCQGLDILLLITPFVLFASIYFTAEYLKYKFLLKLNFSGFRLAGYALMSLISAVLILAFVIILTESVIDPVVKSIYFHFLPQVPSGPDLWRMY